MFSEPLRAPSVSSLAACALLACILPAAAASADVISVGASADNTLFEDSLGSLSSGAGQHMFAGRLLTGSIRRAAIRFDLSSVPAGAIVTGVTMRLSMSRSVSTGEETTLHTITQNWGQAGSNAGMGGAGAPAQPGDATWLHAAFNTTLWANAGGDFAAAPSASTIVGGNGFYSWSSASMAADVQSWLNGSGNFGWMILGNEADVQSAKRFDTRENADASVRPVLTITYIIPSPAPAAFIAAAMLPLAARRRR